MSDDLSQSLEAEKEYVRMHKTRFQDVLELIPRNQSPDFKVLDIGIGGGYLALPIRRTLGYQVVGLDLARPEQPVWVKRFKENGIGFVQCDIAKQPMPFASDSFDLVLFLEVLEHLLTWHPPYEVINEIWRVMMQGAMLILTVPNVAALHKRILTLLGFHPTMHGFGAETPPYKRHIREYTVRECCGLLRGCRFDIRRIMMRNYVMTTSLPFPLNRVYSLLTLYPRFRDTIVVVARKQRAMRRLDSNGAGKGDRVG